MVFEFLNPYQANITPIKKTVNSFTIEISGLVSILLHENKRALGQFYKKYF